MSPGPRLAVAGIVGVETCLAFETYAVVTALPSTMRELHAPAAYSLAFAATLVTAVTGMALAGPWVDRAGPRRPVLVGVGAFVAGLTASALAPEVAVLVGGRLVQGLGIGVLQVAMYGVISQAVPAARHSEVFGMLNAAWLVPRWSGPRWPV